MIAPRDSNHQAYPINHTASTITNIFAQVCLICFIKKCNSKNKKGKVYYLLTGSVAMDSLSGLALAV